MPNTNKTPQVAPETVPSVVEQPVAPETTPAAVEQPTAPVAEETVAPVAPETVAPVEPRKRYRGKVVLAESERVVGNQQFKHILTEEGHEYDLSDIEYRTEVYVSYPPNA